MKKRKDEGATPAELRSRAEQRLRERAERAGGRPPSPRDAAKLVHELQVHQIELEMQNEELLRARAELEAAVARYSDLYEFAPVAYFSLARDGAILQTNLTGARLLGAARAELVRRRLAAFVVSPDLPAYNALFARALEGKVVAVHEVALAPLSDAGGEPAHVQISLSTSPDGEEVRAVVVDVTERRRAEEQLQSWQRLEAIGRLASGVAHHFNNQLTVILSNAALAMDAAEEGSQLREDLAELTAAAQRSALLTRQLLAFGRRQVLRRQLVDVNALVGELAVMLRKLLGAKIEVALALDADVGPVEVDPTQLESVIMNLAINARDAMPDGGTLTISTRNMDIDDASASKFPMRRAGPFVLMAMKDTGVGMDEATRARIFEPFFTTKVHEQRVGFGLAAAYGIVHQCGGDVAVRSAPHRGTIFDVYLPRLSVEASSRPPSAAPQSAGRADGAKTILLVEDDEALLRATRRILASAGYTVLAAASGEEALRISAEHAGTIHLVLSDVLMPAMTGVELADKLRDLRPETPVLHMSGYFEGDLPPQRPDANHIGKPFTVEGLKRKIREVLAAQGRAAREEPPRDP